MSARLGGIEATHTWGEIFANICGWISLPERCTELSLFYLQLTLEEFKLGRFQSSHHRGCPDGHLQIVDGPVSGGQFCGLVDDSTRIRPVFVSETGNLKATLRFYQFHGEELDDNFSVRIRYKFLNNDTAVSR